MARLFRIFKQQIVFFQKNKKKKSAGPLVAVAERVVLDNKVKKMGRLFLNAGIKVLAAKGLVDIAKNGLQAMVPLLPEKVSGLVTIHKFCF